MNLGILRRSWSQSQWLLSVNWTICNMLELYEIVSMNNVSIVYEHNFIEMQSHSLTNIFSVCFGAFMAKVSSC
jgi:hypothetical protein